MFGIEVEGSGTRVRVRLEGEFDACSLPDLGRGLDEACAPGRPVVVDLSGVTFLDLRSTRELVVRSLMHAHILAFENPSPGVLASARALGVGGATRTGRGEPPVFSGA